MDIENTLVISPNPHVRSSRTTQNIMLDVIIALLPASVASVIIFGLRALAVIAVSVGAAVLSEWIFELICKRKVTIGDLSAIVTGLLLALNLPANIPLPVAALGSAIAIIVVKQLFGGIGKNFANPAIAARIILLLSFSDYMTDFVYDGVSSATPLVAENAPSYLDLFLGKCGGSMGETCALALLVGGVYLIVRRVISWHIPVVYIATVFGLSFLFGADPVMQILSGGLMLGAIFMATDYSTSPSSTWGKVIFGFGCGLVTVLIRLYGNSPEGVSYAILFMNILTPYISSWTKKKPFGGAKS